MIYVKSENQLLSLAHKEKEIMIFGAGKIAEEIIKIMPADGKYHISGIIVTDINKNASALSGIPVRKITDSRNDKNKMIFVAVGRKHQEKILYDLKKHSFFNISVISEEFESKLNKRSIINPNDTFKDIEQCLKRIIPQTRLEALVVNICDHCNLNCKGCDHFSPIADERYVTLERIKCDLEQMKYILGEDLELISIMGGEPLLHPDLIKIIKITRNIFQNTKIWISTNGILLLNQDKEFWKCCKENAVEICVTKYPVKFDYNKAKELSEKYGVKWIYYKGDIVEKTLGHYPLDIEGGQDARENFIHCFHANAGCNMLSEGRLYTCTVAPNMPIFAKKYNIDIVLKEEDGIDIYSVNSKKNLFEYLSRPMPICRYCNIKKRTFEHLWEQSKGKMQEWT